MILLCLFVCVWDWLYFRRVQYVDFWWWTIKMSLRHSLLLKKYHSIVQQRTLSAAGLAPPYRYTVQCDIHSHQMLTCSTLTGHCTYAQSQKRIICICFKALLVKHLIHMLFWRTSERVHMKRAHTFKQRLITRLKLKTNSTYKLSFTSDWFCD